jgi:hypothetical protein
VLIVVVVVGRRSIYWLFYSKEREREKEKKERTKIKKKLFEQ